MTDERQELREPLRECAREIARILNLPGVDAGAVELVVTDALAKHGAFPQPRGDLRECAREIAVEAMRAEFPGSSNFQPGPNYFERFAVILQKHFPQPSVGGVGAELYCAAAQALAWLMEYTHRDDARQAKKRLREALVALRTPAPAEPVAITGERKAAVLDLLYRSAAQDATELLTDAEQMAEVLSWALDLLDMYDERLAGIDGHEKVYSAIHVEGKRRAREILAGHLAPAGQPYKTEDEK